MWVQDYTIPREDAIAGERHHRPARPRIATQGRDHEV